MSNLRELKQVEVESNRRRRPMVALIQKNKTYNQIKKNKRNRIEMLVDILRVASNGATKSQIVFKANLNFTIVNAFLESLKTAGLIAGPKGVKHEYQTTEKGFNFLDYFQDVKDYLKPSTR